MPRLAVTAQLLCLSLTTAAARVMRYLDGRGVAPSPDAITGLAQLDGPLPDRPVDPEAVLELLD